MFSPDFLSGNKSFYIFLFIILFCCEAKTQTCTNLIPNPSFENYKSCYFNVFGTTYNAAIFDSLSDWFIPIGGGSTDYFNTCSDALWSFSVPSSVQGFQYPKTGNGFIGFGTFQKDAFFNTLGYVHEYARVKLITKLKPNKKYCLQFYASQSDTSNYKTRLLQGLFTSSDTSIYNENKATELAQITITKEFSEIYIAKWQLWEGSFIAKGNEEYLTLGNLQNDSIVDTLFFNNHHYPTYFSYYFIDDVELCECSSYEITFPNVFTPNNDGINDAWSFNTIDETYNLKIFNRWGNLIIDNQQNKWDGKSKYDDNIIDGVYYFIYTSETKKEKGFIQLIR